jgi:hypothetical protein
MRRAFNPTPGAMESERIMSEKKNLGRVVEDFWGAPPLVTGEDIHTYEQLFKALVDEWEPEKVDQWMDIYLLANGYLNLRRCAAFEAAVVNELIANGLVQELMALEPAKCILKIHETLGDRAKHLSQSQLMTIAEGKNGDLGQEWRRVSFQAVAGDLDAVKVIDREIGPGRVGIRAEWGYQAVLPALLLVRRLKDATEASLERALARLERCKRPKPRKLVPPPRDGGDAPGAPAQVAADNEVSVEFPRDLSSKQPK